MKRSVFFLFLSLFLLLSAVENEMNITLQDNMGDVFSKQNQYCQIIINSTIQNLEFSSDTGSIRKSAANDQIFVRFNANEVTSITVKAPGFNSASINVKDMKSGQIRFYAITGKLIEIGKGKVLIQSKPSGADIFVENGKVSLGKTPFAWNEAPYGTTKLVLKKSNYKDGILSVQVNDDKIVRASIDLKSNITGVEIYTEPIQGKVYLNDLYFDHTPIVKHSFPSSIKKNNYLKIIPDDIQVYDVYTDSIRIHSDSLNVFKIKFTKISHDVTFSTNSPNPTYKVFSEDNKLIYKGPNPQITLKGGNYKVMALNENYLSDLQTFSVKKSGSTAIPFSLEPFQGSQLEKAQKLNSKIRNYAIGSLAGVILWATLNNLSNSYYEDYQNATDSDKASDLRKKTKLTDQLKTGTLISLSVPIGFTSWYLFQKTSIKNQYYKKFGVLKKDL